MKPCSVVPGLPNTCRTPSARSCSIIARLPVILGMGNSPSSGGVGAILTQGGKVDGRTPRGVSCEQSSRSRSDHSMRFGIFGSAQAKRGGPDVDSGAGFREFVDYNVEAEGLGYQSSFVVEHHFTGFGQISATLNLLTWVGARTNSLR